MNWINSFWIAITTYSILPAPHIEWRHENIYGSICFLPVIGVFIAAVLLLWHYLCRAFMVDTTFFAVIAAVLPVLLTGGIHMDGFMDTADALASRQSRIHKLEIMKDSHTGAFAVMGCISYLLLSFAVYGVLYTKTAWWLIGLSFILSRSLCVLNVLTLPAARSDGMLYTLTANINQNMVRAMFILSLLCAVLMLLLELKTGISVVIIAAAAFFIYRSMAIKQFGGVTGDTSGFFIMLCELCLLFAIWIGGLL